MKTLDQIALNYRTDKASKYHNYTPVYEHYFKDLRDKEIVLLELGIGDINSLNREGESILMWREYFTKGKCYAIDNSIDKANSHKDCFWCSQTDDITLNSIINKIGNPDIIIDDASHIQSNTIYSFEILFPLLKSGGLYCIEDTVTSYWPQWEGSHNIFHYNTDMGDRTIVSYMLELCHFINLKRQETFNPSRKCNVPDWIKEIDSIHFHHSQIIIKKK